MTRNYRSVSLWMDSLPDEISPRPALGSALDVDVAIVGAGYTGLWTAYYLLHADPTLRIAILEKEIAGFGASGRNGGWCSALFSAGKDKIARRYGRHAAVAMQRALIDTVDEVGRVLSREGIDAHFVKGGTLTFATTEAHLHRLRRHVEEEVSWGLTDDDVRWLSAPEAQRRITLTGCLGAAFTPHCARVQPALLVRGLAGVVERMGAALYEQTPAAALAAGVVITSTAKVEAEVVVRATEGYTPTLSGYRRDLVPVYSLMIATEPLPKSFWDEVGWDGWETITDGRHLLIYAQRTGDDRIAIGGRGAPYHFGSRVKDGFDGVPAVFDALERVLGDLFPQMRSAAITHRWGGPLGIPRDWFSSVGYDRARRSAWAGGYVGDGVAAANLAGRTLAALILERDDDLVHLPWVGHRSRSWEPEPLRWLGINLALKAMASADRIEARTGRPALRADLARRLIG